MSLKTYRAKQDCNPDDPENEMVLAKGDILEQQEDENWSPDDDFILCVNKRTDQCAYADVAMIEEVKDEQKPDLTKSDVEQQASKQNDDMAGMPPMLPPTELPGAPPAPQFTATADADADSFKELFEKHEQYFKAVAEKRDESFKKLADAIHQAQEEINGCRERNNKIRDQIKELDNLIDTERQKWKERLDMENKM